MDLEGAEWSVLPDLAQHNLLCKPYVNEVFIELHFWGPDPPEAWKRACAGCAWNVRSIELCGSNA